MLVKIYNNCDFGWFVGLRMGWWDQAKPGSGNYLGLFLIFWFWLFQIKCRLWCANICSGLQKCLPIVRVLRVKNQTYKMRQIGCLCLQAWSVVYFNELWVASRIKKLVEILFCVCFKPFFVDFWCFWAIFHPKQEKDMKTKILFLFLYVWTVLVPLAV